MKFDFKLIYTPFNKIKFTFKYRIGKFRKLEDLLSCECDLMYISQNKSSLKIPFGSIKTVLKMVILNVLLLLTIVGLANIFSKVQ